MVVLLINMRIKLFEPLPKIKWLSAQSCIYLKGRTNIFFLILTFDRRLNFEKYFSKVVCSVLKWQHTASSLGETSFCTLNRQEDDVIQAYEPLSRNESWQIQLTWQFEVVNWRTFLLYIILLKRHKKIGISVKRHRQTDKQTDRQIDRQIGRQI